jgi:hypothetical protein
MVTNEADYNPSSLICQMAQSEPCEGLNLNLRKAEGPSTGQMKGSHSLLPQAREPIEGLASFGRSLDHQADALPL